MSIDDESALTKRLQMGFAAQGGVMSTLLSEKGLTGAQKSMEGRFGIFNLHQRGEYYRDVLLQGLGSEYEVVNLSFKPYPCCRENHPYIDAALQLMRDHAIVPENITEVMLIVNDEFHLLCHPIEIKRRPREIVHAQFSLPYTVSVAICRGKVVIDDFTPQAIKDEKVLAMAQKVNVKYDPTLTTSEVAPAVIEVTLKDGRKITSDRVVYAKGHPKNPMDMDDLSEKFRDCATHSAVPLPKENVENAP